jgi:hypothetical protein
MALNLAEDYRTTVLDKIQSAETVSTGGGKVTSIATAIERPPVGEHSGVCRSYSRRGVMQGTQYLADSPV